MAKIIETPKIEFIDNYTQKLDKKQLVTKPIKSSSNRPKLFTKQVVIKLSPELLTTIDYVSSNYRFNNEKIYSGRSNFIRSSCIHLLRLKLKEMECGICLGKA